MPDLQIVTYHYVRDLPRTRFPEIKGMLVADFRKQIAELSAAYEMATLESAIAYLTGVYRPRRDLCLLTFDDGLKEHFTTVTPILADVGVQGLFHVITGCLGDHRVAPVHMNHFLMATLRFEEYSRAFLKEINVVDRDAADLSSIDVKVARHTYPWDTDAVALFKYAFNFLIDAGTRDRVVKQLFDRHLGKEEPFANELYVNWTDARQMQEAGMVIGGHSHRHRPLSVMPESDLAWDIARCRELLDEHLNPQPQWPFCYPYGKRNSFSSLAVTKLQDAGFVCSFTTEIEPNRPGSDLFSINRVDCKCALAA